MHKPRVLFLLATGMAVLVSGCGPDAVASRQERGSGVQNHPGVRNEALREASRQFGVPLEILAAVAYQKGRFELPQPASMAQPLTEDIAPGSVPPGLTASEMEIPDNPHPPEASTTPEPEEVADVHVHQELWGIARLTPGQVSQGAALAKRDEEDVRTDIAAGIQALAALLSEHARELGHSPEAFEVAIERMMEADDADSAALVREELRTLLEQGFDLTTSDGERIELLGTAVKVEQSLAPGKYPPLQWIASPNFSSRSGASIRYVVIHDMEGTQSSAVTVFKRKSRQASAHYLLRANDGHIVQMVRETDNAWHCGNGHYNRNSIGIEHEGYADKPNGGGYYTPTQYRSSAKLVCAIAKRYNIPINRSRIFGHGNVPSSGSGALCSDAQSHAGKCGGASHHHDPGRYWNWSYYLGLVKSCVDGNDIDGSPAEFLRGDFDGDGRTDIVEYRSDTWTTLPLCLSKESGWQCSNPQAKFSGGDYGAGNGGSGVHSGGKPLVGDFNGDGKADLAQYNGTWKSIPVCYSTGTGWNCRNQKAHYAGEAAAAGNEGTAIYARGTPLVGDFDGDGKTDVLQYNAAWTTLPVCFSRGQSWDCQNHKASHSGEPAEAGNSGTGIYSGGTPLIGDFNGDGRADVAQYNSSWMHIPICYSREQGWDCQKLYAFYSGEGSRVGNGGVTGVYAGSTPLVADFNGDGMADIAQYNASWSSIPVCYFQGTVWGCENQEAHYSGGAVGAGTGGGGIYPGGAPLVGDFNGDGKADIGQYRNSWTTLPVCYSTASGWSCLNNLATFSGGGQTAGNSGTGIHSGGAPLVGDFSGDGASDIVQYNHSWKSLPTCFAKDSAWSCFNRAATIYK